MTIDRRNVRFLWVSLQLQNLCSNRIILERDLEEELNRLPQNLTEVYKQIYGRICNLALPSQMVAKRSLTWLSCSQEQLSTEAFLEVILSNSDQTFTRLSKSDILHVSCNLIVLDTELDVFRLAHLSVLEFLDSHLRYRSTTAHSLLAKICLARLGSSQDSTFSKYARMYWAYRCQSSGDQRAQGELKGLFRNFLRPEATDVTVTPFMQWSSSMRNDNILAIQRDYEIRDKTYDSLGDPAQPLFAACAWGFTEVIPSLLEATSKRKHEKVQHVRKFIPTSTPIMQNSNGRTYLQIASK